LSMHMRSAAAGGLLVLVLAGCGSQTVDVGGVAVESTVAASSASVLEDTYVELVHSGVPSMASVSGDALVRMASTVCGVLTGEVTAGPVNSPGTYSQWKTAVDALGGLGVPQRDAGAFIVYATSFNCPEKVSEYLPPSG
jgi:hypothetical protein